MLVESLEEQSCLIDLDVIDDLTVDLELDIPTHPGVDPWANFHLILLFFAKVP